MPKQVHDLRSALELLRSLPGQLVETDVPVDPSAELSGVYRHVGAGGTVARPTREGPAMIFRSIKGHPNAQVAIGVLASRKRVAALLDCPAEELGWKLRSCVSEPIPPVMLQDKHPQCQEEIHLATDEGFDLFKLVPAPTNTPDDAGPYITLGMCYATHPYTGVNDITIHRMCIQGKDELSIYFTPGARHIGAMVERAEQLGQPLPISISIGVDPAIEIAACFELSIPNRTSFEPKSDFKEFSTSREGFKVRLLKEPLLNLCFSDFKTYFGSKRILMIFE